MINENGTDFSGEQITKEATFHVVGHSGEKLSIESVESKGGNKFDLFINLNDSLHVLTVKKTNGDDENFNCTFLKMVDLSNCDAELTRADLNKALSCKKSLCEYAVIIRYFVNDIDVYMNKKKISGLTVFEYTEQGDDAKVTLLFSVDKVNITGAIEVEACCGQNAASIDSVSVL